jgi:flagellar M-ring protein FliF
VVNHKREVDKDGNVTLRPLTEQEKTQITDLVKEAMGYSQARGDSLNVMNSAFAETPPEVIPEQPFWKPYANIETAKTVVQYLLSLGAIAYLFFAVLRPMIMRLTGQKTKAQKAAEAEAAAKLAEEAEAEKKAQEAEKAAEQAAEASAAPALPEELTIEAEKAAERAKTYQENLQTAKDMAAKDPKMVANIMRDWMNGNE